jgi:hypothetical protein
LIITDPGSSELSGFVLVSNWQFLQLGLTSQDLGQKKCTATFKKAEYIIVHAMRLSAKEQSASPNDP